MTVLSRGARSRRGGRRPGWMLLTALLVLAIAASSALVFTNRVELLKLAVILALWAAVVAAFVSVIYRRQSDMDQARARDLKLVYDLQLDREISARREYELTVETQLRRELATELRAQAADEVASLRAELAALRANLEILFDADLGHRPAIETDRTTVRAYSDWAPDSETTGRVTASRIDTEDRVDFEDRTEESPIIDVPAEPHPPEHEWAPPAGDGGAHRRPSEAEPQGRREPQEELRSRRYREALQEPTSTWQPPPPPPPQPAPPVEVPKPPQPEPQPETQVPWPPQQPEPAPSTSSTDWQPAPAEGQWIPAGTPGSNWVAPPVAENGSSGEYVGRRRAPEAAMSTPPAEPPHGRHSALSEVGDPGRPSPPTLATPPPEAPEQPSPRRRRSAEEARDVDSQHADGQSAAELLARFHAAPSGGGRRRRREE